ncbi:hypothetical protein V6N13_114573 [Hibiscus sabdariffa]|uniref:Auxin-responsive protein n=1 Tax=Hibiscus sabdariffa TaxID=183260 RepID=A0ABR2U282_9ROSI
MGSEEAPESEVSSMSFRETELTLGLPGEGRPSSSAVKCSTKRGIAATVAVCKSGAGESHPAKAQVVGWPPVRSCRKNERFKYVKVGMDGAPYLRKVNLQGYSNYQDLFQDLNNLFNCSTIGANGEENKHMIGVKRMEYVTTYEDKDSDWMLVGDVPWKMKLYTYIYVFKFVLLLSWLRSSEADSGSFNVNKLAVNGCTIVDCAQGTCRESDTSLLGFECDCYPGWIKLQFGPFSSPCMIPNCTLNLGCGSESPSPPPPPPPTFNLSDLCSFAWCGDGSCKTTGSDYECDCNDGSANLLAKPALPCLKQCALGTDCHGVWLGKPPGTSSSPPTTSSSPPPYTPSSHGRASRIQDSLKILLILVALFHQWL